MAIQIHELGRPACVTDLTFPRTVASEKRWRRNSASRRDVVK